MFSKSGKNIKRIALLSVHTCPLALMGGKKTGGMNVYVRGLAAELGRIGIQVDVFTRSEDKCQPSVKHNLGYGGRVIHVPAGPEVPMRPAEITPYLDQFTAGVLKFAAQENAQYDVIHSHYWLSGLVAGKLREAWQAESGRYTPIVQMFHTLGHMKNQINPNAAERAPQARIDGEMRIIHDIADMITSPTPAEVQQLEELYHADTRKIRVIPPGVDLGRFQAIPQPYAKERIGIRPEQRNIMFVGRIEPLKGIDTFIEAASILRDHHPDLMETTTFSIIGGNPWAENLETEMVRLQTLHHELKVEDIVGFVGAKDQSKLPYYYAATDVVVMPSHYESFGLVALEAMAMGTPVIASEVGGLAHLVQNGITGFHVPPRNSGALAEQICILLHDEPLRQQLGKQAYDLAQNYDWSVVVDYLVNVYEEAQEVCAEISRPTQWQDTAAKWFVMA